MHEGRFAAFRRRVHALPGPAVWARTSTLRAGTRRATEPGARGARGARGLLSHCSTQ
jgi:hypothetical protein